MKLYVNARLLFRDYLRSKFRLKVKTDLAAPIGIMHSYENRGIARKTNNPKTVTIWYHLQDAPTASSPKNVQAI